MSREQMYYDVSLVKEALSGPVPSVCPSFLPDNELDWDSMANNVDFLIASGAKTLLITYGDSLLSILSDDETCAFARFVTERARHRAMVIGCGRLWPPKQTLEFAEFCKAYGTDVVIPFVPDWAQHSDAGLLVNYFKAVGKIMPVMALTNIGTRGIPCEVSEQLQQEDGIVAIKDDVPLPYGEALGHAIGGRFAFLSGGTAGFFLKEAPYGADGYRRVLEAMGDEV